jgi:hypothetical protein
MTSELNAGIKRDRPPVVPLNHLASNEYSLALTGVNAAARERGASEAMANRDRAQKDQTKAIGDLKEIVGNFFSLVKSFLSGQSNNTDIFGING